MRIVAVAVLALCACASEQLPEYRIPVPNALAMISPAAAYSDDVPGYSYVPQGKRDPFGDTSAPRRTRCESKRHFLRDAELASMSLRMTTTGLATPMAVVVDRLANPYEVQVGDALGAGCLRVAAIRPNALVLEDVYLDASNREVRRTVELALDAAAQAIRVDDARERGWE